MTEIDCFCEDLSEVIALDKNRLMSRQNSIETSNTNTEYHNTSFDNSTKLTAISEEDENDYN